MCSKQQLKNFLEYISENAKFALFNYVSAEHFTALVKCRVENDQSIKYYSDFCKEWIRKFSSFTKTSWIVRKCFPNLKRLVYRKVYICHRSSHNKKKMADTSSARNKQCSAKIDFKMKFINRNTIKNDKSLKEGLNLHIFIDFVHTHGVLVRESLDLLKCSMDTDEMFRKYFADGHTVTTAKSYHELTLLSKYGASDDEYLSNVEDVNPSLQHVTYLHRKMKDEISHNVADSMAAKKNVLEERGGALRYTDDYSVAVVITPYMKNVLSGHDLDYIIIDSTALKEIVVSFFLLPTALGALPIACALHSQDTEPSYSQAFFSTKLLLENQTFTSFEPTKIMINVLDEQNHALDAIFTNKSLFVSRASMVEEIWRIICDNDSKVNETNRHGLLVSFHAFLHADSFKEAEKYYKLLDSDETVQSTTKLKEYLKDIWKRQKDYMNQNENEVLDLSIRTLKQFLLSKCYAFNTLTMIDVLSNILDNHWCEILHANLRDRSMIETYTKFLNKDKRVLNKLGMNSSGHEYTLTNAKTRKLITFRSDTMCCDCLKGRKGWLCDHLCGLLQSMELKASVPKDKRPFYRALAGEDVRGELYRLKFEGTNQDTEMEEVMSNDSDEDRLVIKEEVDSDCDPLHDNTDNVIPEETIAIEDKKKTNYETALKALNDEFRRLNKMFRDNPNTSNLETMGRLARELSKIRPVEKLNVSNLHVEVNNGDTEDK
ncbi:unnamed protein product [Chrysodeixis includens]|uniref:SWIM-type domain-containing protein n=1 Tax=Chrysodeixis includens TaxID=689277 RepID=A0A9P0BXY3_CHRIL|nr:unnamed protein product [Chrysodeixis includens]